MVQQAGFFDVEERLRELSAKGDCLERIAALLEIAQFRPRTGTGRGAPPASLMALPMQPCNRATALSHGVTTSCVAAWLRERGGTASSPHSLVPGNRRYNATPRLPPPRQEHRQPGDVAL